MPNEAPSLLKAMGERYSVDPKKLLDAIKRTVFNGDASVTVEELMTFLQVCHEMGLSPFMKHVHAFKGRNGQYQPVISYDGWLKVLHSQSDFCGLEITESESEAKPGVPSWLECRIFRNGFKTPFVVRERFNEVVQKTQVWDKYPNRMLRNRVVIQAIRLAYGFSDATEELSMDSSNEVKQIPNAISKEKALEIIKKAASKEGADFPKIRQWVRSRMRVQDQKAGLDLVAYYEHKSKKQMSEQDIEDIEMEALSLNQTEEVEVEEVDSVPSLAMSKADKPKAQAQVAMSEEDIAEVQHQVDLVAAGIPDGDYLEDEAPF